MKLSILSLFLIISIVSFARASSSFDDFAREQLWNIIQDNDSQSDDRADLVRRDYSKYYKEAPK